jgi:hypothetical protein
VWIIQNKSNHNNTVAFVLLNNKNILKLLDISYNVMYNILVRLKQFDIIVKGGRCMKRTCIYENNSNKCIKCFMTASSTTVGDLKSIYPNMSIEIDELECGDIDISKTYKELYSSLQKAITWLVNNGFSGKLVKYNTSGAELMLQKDGITDTLKLTNTTLNSNKVNILDYMKQFGKSFEMLKELTTLRKRANELISNNM